jgi:hypothetical protein
MTLNDIVQKTIESQLKQADIEAFCEQEQTTTEAFCDEFARFIATGYMDGRLSYESADCAIAALYFHFDFGVPDFTSAVFGCFDTAEYRRTQGLNPDEVARPLVKKILEDKHEPAA